ncbi:phosphatidylserine decarboxylase [Rubrobacter marinus]|uniref:phosphatidylserine decarboxylase n=1 Tax=Rubrobacter marinus TaxID=2653852 RepID=UPI001D18AC63|nr:phosphatidylserine decarboxylase [Rubrobacter marinus]
MLKKPGSRLGQDLYRRALFLGSMILHPRRVGAVWPTGRRAVADLLDMEDLSRADVVVEFGTGIGVYTEEILRRLGPDGVFLAFEVDERLAHAVAARLPDPRLTVINDSAENVERYLSGRKADAVVSSLPFTTLPASLKEEILVAARDALRPGGSMLVLQYSKNILPDLERLFGGIRRRFSPLNVPPPSSSPARRPKAPQEEGHDAQKLGRRPVLLPPPLALGALLLVLGRRRLGWAGLVASLGVLAFFRDPERRLVPEPGVAYAAADGFVKSVEPVEEEALPEGRGLSISTFLSLHNVHVNRSPIAGTVSRFEEIEGGYAPALFESSEGNRRNRLVVEGGDGTSAVVIPKAGSIARRISSWVGVGDEVEAGGRIGLIHFGSRTDVILPEGWEPLVSPGERVLAGLTPIARRATPPAGGTGR